MARFDLKNKFSSNSNDTSIRNDWKRQYTVLENLPSCCLGLTLHSATPVKAQEKSQNVTMSAFSHDTVSLISNGQILLYSFITDLFYTMMGCVHAQQLHFNSQIMRLNVKITRQNSMVCVMHEARPGKLIAIKKHDSVKQNILFLQTCRNKLSFKQPRSLVKRNSI